jgi:hypothetical protein
MGYLVFTVDKMLTRVTLRLQYGAPQFPVPSASIRWIRRQVPTFPRTDNVEMREEEREVQDKGDEDCHPKPDVLPAKSFSLVSIAKPAPVLSHINVTNKENRCQPPYRIWNCIVFLRWVSVYTKPNSDKEGHKKKFNGNGNHRDGSVGLCKPPYCQKGLHSDGLQINMLDNELAEVWIHGLPAWSRRQKFLPADARVLKARSGCVLLVAYL